MKTFYLLIIIQTMCLGLMAQTPVAPMGNGTQASPYRIGSLENLYWITLNPQHWDKYYMQTDSIDASDTKNWYSGKGWLPIGKDMDPFTGTYDGQNFTINQLHIHRFESRYVGLFGMISSGKVLNLGLTNAVVYGDSDVGALVGRIRYQQGSIDNCYTTGLVQSLGSLAGGLAGACTEEAFIHNSYSTVNIYGNDITGGLAGYLYDGFIENCFATGYVEGGRVAGGLVGVCRDNISFIKTSYFSGIVTAEYGVGGLVGLNFGSLITNCYSTGGVGGYNNAGGLIGDNYGSIIHCYSTGKIEFDDRTGGLVGTKWAQDVGWSEENFYDINNYWDIQTSGITVSAMGYGRTTKQMTFPYADNTYQGWDFKNIWRADLGARHNNGYPYLYWQHPKSYVTCAMGSSYWFANRHTHWPYDVIIGGRRYSRQQSQDFWPANTVIKKAFVQYASVYLSGTNLSIDQELGWSMRIIDSYFTYDYPGAPRPEVGPAISYIAKWIANNNCHGEKTKSEMAFIEPDNLKVFPNPFRDYIMFEFTPEEDTPISVVLYNLVGEKVTIPVSYDVQASQTFQFSLNTVGLPDGIYIYQLETPTQVYHDNLVLTRFND